VLQLLQLCGNLRKIIYIRIKERTVMLGVMVLQYNEDTDKS